MSNQLGIDVDTIIRTKCKSYLDTLGDQAESYVSEMKEASGKAIQDQIDKSEALLKAIQDTAQACIDSSKTWAIQIPLIATPDPTAPKAGAATLVSLQNSVIMAKANLSVAKSQQLDLIATINAFGVSIPPIVQSTNDLLDQAIDSLNNIPIV